ncbi:pyridoxamine 5'-phosphate oxidase family protein [Leptothrix discophora]|uniref:Pyridoxamine 5'-phosphate oxidase family protein n=1 Tax=Leptothrix discophora TaxID=89 RepID=A0ABT9G822_LEPDI|nr:pyridoxamine 5'-phosphate oxidase family protein [Leptothrix discophora]MDP4302561.1 pyridoxamine 5'-phosphate oxidase family protein [Leptothrix discophora]
MNDAPNPVTSVPAATLPRHTTLSTLESLIWTELDLAVHSRASADRPAHPWRRAAFATVGEDGPEVRSIVLRDLQADRRELVFYADARSPKVAQLRADPRGQILCWSEPLGWQVRLACTIEIATDGLDVTARWARIRHRPAAHDYLSPLAPGSPLEAPAVPLAPERVRESFAVLTARVRAIDWLELHAQGHRRARFEHGREPQWLVP